MSHWALRKSPRALALSLKRRCKNTKAFKTMQMYIVSIYSTRCKPVRKKSKKNCAPLRKSDAIQNNNDVIFFFFRTQYHAGVYVARCKNEELPHTTYEAPVPTSKRASSEDGVEFKSPERVGNLEPSADAKGAP